MSVATDRSMATALTHCELFGFKVCTSSLETTLERIEEIVKGESPQFVATADSYGIVLAQENTELADFYRKAAIVTPDSSGVVWALNRKGCEVSRVSGVDLVDRICALSSQNGFRIFFLGSAPGVAELAAHKLRLKHPGCNIVGTRDGFFAERDSESVAKVISLTAPDILFVAMGIPRQESFIARTLGLTGAKVSMGVGGSLDVYSGKVKRAPKWVQSVGVEWLWRLILNPKKFQKVSRLPKFAWLVLRGRS